MDDRRFDALVRSLASGNSRRQILKGLLGLGGGAMAGVTLRPAGAARRPTPTPKPVQCPGNQIWNGSACVCPGGTAQCGPACCSAGATCCDNACCNGYCYGEELCCPSSREFCAATGECCSEGLICCPESGCILPGQCCTAADCTPGTCQSAICNGNHTCEYAFDCTVEGGCCLADTCHRRDCRADGSCTAPIFDCNSGEGECCPAETCERSDCRADGSCADPVFDCTADDGCCTADVCYRSDCQGDGSCAEPVFDCNRHEETDCCGEGEVCLADGFCCPPVCEGDFCGMADGCGGVCGCPEGLTCLNGGCFKMFQTCLGVHDCEACGGCQCGTDLASGLVACMNKETGVAACNSSADCPLGSTCSNLLSGNPDLRHLCVYPCCTGA